MSMSELYRRDLCWAGLEAADAEEVLGIIARALVGKGLVQPSFEAALLEREERSPTGLPLPGKKVAIPHADPEHVIADAIPLCTLARPVTFREMGNPDSELPVEIVAVLALTKAELVQQELVRLVERFQDASFVDRLHAAADADAMLALIREQERP
jgi:PTS system galactitol-specific IIA component